MNKNMKNEFYKMYFFHFVFKQIDVGNYGKTNEQINDLISSAKKDIPKFRGRSDDIKTAVIFITPLFAMLLLTNYIMELLALSELTKIIWSIIASIIFCIGIFIYIKKYLCNSGLDDEAAKKRGYLGSLYLIKAVRSSEYTSKISKIDCSGNMDLANLIHEYAKLEETEDSSELTVKRIDILKKINESDACLVLTHRDLLETVY